MPRNRGLATTTVTSGPSVTDCLFLSTPNVNACFYLEKQALFGPGEQYRMADDVLSAFQAFLGQTFDAQLIRVTAKTD